jgi:hypothetical protein
MPGPTVQISAGALSTDAAKLEVQLSRTFKIVNHWNLERYSSTTQIGCLSPATYTQ